MDADRHPAVSSAIQVLLPAVSTPGTFFSGTPGPTAQSTGFATANGLAIGVNGVGGSALIATYDIGAGKELPMTLRPTIEDIPRIAGQMAQHPIARQWSPLAPPLQLPAAPGGRISRKHSLRPVLR